MSEPTSGRVPPSAGTWRQIAAVVDGKDLSVGRSTFLTVTPHGYTVTVLGRVYQTGTTVADYSTDPPRSDVSVATGASAGHTLRQIFRVDGDVLVACAAGPDGERPTAFASPPGSGHALSVWVRVPDRPAPTITPAAWWVVLIVSLMVGGGFGEAAEKGVVGDVGVWGALAVRCAVSGVLVGLLAFGLSRLTRADRHTRAELAGLGVLFGIALPLTLGVFENLRKLLEPEHGWLGWGLALLAGSAAGLAASAVLVAVLKRAGLTTPGA